MEVSMWLMWFEVFSEYCHQNSFIDKFWPIISVQPTVIVSVDKM